MHAFVAGGAGFIGSHVVERLLHDSVVDGVTVYDNFSSGKREYLPEASDSRLRIVEADISRIDDLCRALEGHDVVFHYASNPDIARAMNEPDVDFWQGTFLTQNIVEAMRRCGVGQLIYASGSGVYGDWGEICAREDHGPLLPVSTYGASKLAGEALICAYCHMFGLRAWVFRLANVVGPRQTHGVVYDFLRKLRAQPTSLQILGDGTQSKSYVHVDDVLDAIWVAWHKADDAYNCFNVATDDCVQVSEIASVVTRVMNLEDVKFEYGNGPRGWKGDVPVVRLDASRLKRLGWWPRHSAREAIESSARELFRELERSPICKP